MREEKKKKKKREAQIGEIVREFDLFLIKPGFRLIDRPARSP